MANTQTATTDRPAGGKLSGVQAARGIAALMVVIYHTTRSVSLPQYLGTIPFGNAFGFGHAGVDFFFVLSGFIITHAHVADIGRPDRIYRYLWRRLTRIYPIYWFVTAIYLVRAIFSPDTATRLAPMHLLNSLLLLPETVDPLVGVAWTLRSEMLFYLVFALAVIDRRFCKPLVVATLGLVLIGVFAETAGPWTDLLLSPFNIEFLMGIAAARLLAHRTIPHPAAWVAAGVVFFLAVGALEVLGVVPLNGLIGRMLYGSASVAVLAGLVAMEKRGTLRLGRPGIMLGDASYCLYLIHLAVIPTTVRLCANLGVLGVLPASFVIAALVALSIAVALGLHVWVELPMMTFIRKHTPRLLR